MVLIIGGVYQGKRQFALEKYEPATEASGTDATVEQLRTVALVTEFQEFVKGQLAQGGQLPELIGLMLDVLEENPRLVITASEVGSGIVPLSAEDRDFREAAGRMVTWLGTQAQEVYHVMAGVGLRLK